jgi:hypothetical protein
MRLALGASGNLGLTPLAKRTLARVRCQSAKLAKQAYLYLQRHEDDENDCVEGVDHGFSPRGLERRPTGSRELSVNIPAPGFADGRLLSPVSQTSKQSPPSASMSGFRLLKRNAKVWTAVMTCGMLVAASSTMSDSQNRHLPSLSPATTNLTLTTELRVAKGSDMQLSPVKLLPSYASQLSNLASSPVSTGMSTQISPSYVHNNKASKKLRACTLKGSDRRFLKKSDVDIDIAAVSVTLKPVSPLKGSTANIAPPSTL